MIPWFPGIATHLILLGLVLAVGATLAGWGLFGDRSKGRARCPRCRYDMRGRRAGSSGLICPECGFNARTERQLYKDHRRWAAILPGLLILLLTISSVPVMYGWWQEEAIIRALDPDDIGGAAEGTKSILPNWLTGRLPETLVRYSERASEVQPQTDAGFRLCAGFRHLREFDMRQLSKPRNHSARITDAYLNQLKRMKSIMFLEFERTQLSDAQALDLKQALPNATIRLFHDGYYDEAELAGIVVEPHHQH